MIFVLDNMCVKVSQKNNLFFISREAQNQGYQECIKDYFLPAPYDCCAKYPLATKCQMRTTKRTTTTTTSITEVPISPVDEEGTATTTVATTTTGGTTGTTTTQKLLPTTTWVRIGNYLFAINVFLPEYTQISYCKPIK